MLLFLLFVMVFFRIGPSIYWKWKENNHKNWKTNVNYIAPFPVLCWKIDRPLRRYEIGFFFLYTEIWSFIRTRCNNEIEFDARANQFWNSERKITAWFIFSRWNMSIWASALKAYTSFLIIIDQFSTILSLLLAYLLFWSPLLYPLPQIFFSSILVSCWKKLSFDRPILKCYLEATWFLHSHNVSNADYLSRNYLLTEWLHFNFYFRFLPSNDHFSYPESNLL